jgi:NAD(P)-dependent dehydrogenase (short-subunit alcohol dehydrogenase family)
VVVTGASRGVGAALARACAREGARLGLTATATDHLADLLDELGSSHRGVALDLADPASISAAADRIVASLGRVDVLVNNAGLLGARAPLAAYPMDVWRRVMAVTVDGTLDLTQRLLPAIPDGGAIINVTSGAAGRPGWGAYGISRLALNGITQVLRHELAERAIRCVAINPGGVRTDMRAWAYPDEDPMSVPAPEERLAPFIAVAAGADPGWFVEAKEWPS